MASIKHFGWSRSRISQKRREVGITIHDPKKKPRSQKEEQGL